MDIQFADVEVYSNCFMLSAKHKESGHLNKFLIFADTKSNFVVNDLERLVAFCNRPNELWLITYNGFLYDNQILNSIIVNYWALKNKHPKDICKDIYKVSQDFFTAQNNGGYYNRFKYHTFFKSIDLMRVAGLHKLSTLKGLKQLAVQLKHPRIQDLPIRFDKPILREQLPEMFEYNVNDVDITEAVYNGQTVYVDSPFLPKRKRGTGLTEMVRLRKAITDQYGVDVMNQDKSGMANKLLENLYSKRTGIAVKDFKEERTRRASVKFSDAIFDTIKFKTQEMNDYLDFLKEQVVVTNGPKISIDLDTFWFGGLEYQFSAGGLHSADKGAYFESTDKYSIIDADASSFHPRVMINHRIKPAHLEDDFLDILEEQTDGRLVSKKKAKECKIAGDKIMQMVHETAADTGKIVINSIFGKLGSDTSWLYDPLCMVQVTINNQLYIMMLAERFVLAGFKVISANTDGLTTIVERGREDEYYQCCKEWEKDTRFELEYAYYKKYARTNVNNYLVLKETNGEEFDYDNHIKCKGDLDPFLYENFEKGFDKPVVALAVYNHFINNIPIQDTIRGHTDIYDYCMSKKNDSSYDNEFYTVVDGEVKKDLLQKSNRYYISDRGHGGKLIKAKDTFRAVDGVISKGKRKQAQQVAREYVTIFNDYTPKSMKDYKIKYMYYIVAAQKIIDVIIPKQKSLF
jgi:hypothetical protein